MTKAHVRYTLPAALLIVAIFCTLLIKGSTFDSLIQEDGFIEWLGTLGFLAASGLFFAAWRRARHGSHPPVARLSLLGLALLFFLFGGEEISWGQRLLGISTPESVAASNVQDETNLHNLGFLQNTLGVAELFQLFWWSFGVAIPVIAALWPRARSFFERYIPVFPLWIAALFAFVQIVAEVFQRLLTERPELYESIYPLGYTTVEMVEANVGIVFGLAAYVVFRSLEPAPVSVRTTPHPAR
jgi:hypothetical protein